MYFGWDPTFIFLIPAMILVMWAQARVRSSFDQWSQVAVRSGITAAQVAQDILDKNGISDVRIEHVHGTLTDHYDPKAKVVRLSSSTYHSNSIAAIGVAAHECGHVLQHEHSYVPLYMRNMIVPVANLGSMAGPWLVVLGLFFRTGWLMDVGILLFAAALAFYVITLPVEYNASSRAVEILETGGYMSREEVAGARKVLNAAALTYVAAAAAAVSQLLRLLFLRNMSRNRD
ncbi:MAG TPA: zinc metallopeptidase [Symbiobacteriaceae bacterium]|jgi:Zn-dependent membrane protease YugP|nr:zinc metallopeptidase [Symbiobacteriaceae bacterium]